MPAAAALQGAYISQYTPVPASSVSVEVRTLLSLGVEDWKVIRGRFSTGHSLPLAVSLISVFVNSWWVCEERRRRDLARLFLSFSRAAVHPRALACVDRVPWDEDRLL